MHRFWRVASPYKEIIENESKPQLVFEQSEFETINIVVIITEYWS